MWKKRKKCGMVYLLEEKAKIFISCNKWTTLVGEKLIMERLCLCGLQGINGTLCTFPTILLWTSNLLGSLRNCHKPEEPNVIWWLNVMWYHRWGPGTYKGHKGKTNGIWIMYPVQLIIYQYWFVISDHVLQWLKMLIIGETGYKYMGTLWGLWNFALNLKLCLCKKLLKYMKKKSGFSRF